MFGLDPTRPEFINEILQLQRIASSIWSTVVLQSGDDCGDYFALQTDMKAPSDDELLKSHGYHGCLCKSSGEQVSE
eukprot:scaffold410891_cov15-Prasinocladus_malaysianus.AAC.1